MKIDQIPFDLISKHNENIRVLIVTNSPDLTSIPAKINTLKNLKKFYISGTQVKDLPEDLFKIDGLESFEYNMNQTEKIPSAIGNLTSLKKLNLSLLPITTLPVEIGKLTNLESLEITNNKGGKHIANKSYNLVGIKHLPKEIGNLTKLNKLY
ncbi:leucine-rich repeat domain-containing protein [Faecalibacter bovis]|uniref:Leucine-rich repeat domain-containing protein n=1 Tax=Faecalibacter bovis TaxID=2898187 RepID=A0ABX7XCX2_9FLAO|nr:hypothetical protein [Faecalibacter bovis]QTV05685.1 leucine-rich repeat domain-containing protein [Faecalibacter bovis]